MPQESNDDIIKVRAYHIFSLFPKAPKVLGTEGNQFGIAKFEVIKTLQGNPVIDKRESSITIKGDFFEPIKRKQVYTILAKRQDDPKWGVQYQLMYIAPQIDLAVNRNMRAFLKAFMTEGQIEEFYKLYDNPLEVIAAHDIEKMQAVHGVGPHITNCILDRYEQCSDQSQIYMELEGYGLTPNLIQRLTKAYSNPNRLIKAVKENPYQLIDTVDGIGFKRADEIALRGGLDPKSPKRIAAYIEYFLNSQAEEGNSYISAGLLLQQIYLTFGGKESIHENRYDEEGNITGSNISEAIAFLVNRDLIIVEDSENKASRRVYLKSIWELENNIVYHLRRLLNAPNKFKYDCWKERVKQLEEKQGFSFAQEQIDGIQLGLDKQVCLISGAAGVGKSSLVSGILAGLGDVSFAQCALSGKAAARLQEVTGAAGSTIHRLLGYVPGEGFHYNENEQLPLDVVILDEISLVGGDIFLDLIKAIPTGSKLIMLGDPNQLPSIGKLNLAYDMLKSPKVPSVLLQEIHRQAAKSGIITCAHKVKNQEQIFYDDEDTVQTFGELEDMTFDVSFEKDTIRYRTMDWFDEWYESDIVGHDIMKLQVISPVKERGDACVYNLNCDIQDRINPYENGNPFFAVGQKEYRYVIGLNDKVMCIKNNYHTLNGCPIYNGWVGIVVDIDNENSVVTVNFPLAGGNVMLNMSDAMIDLTLGYASTVHKLQGSDAPVVIGAIDYSTPPKMLSSPLVYTLLTRAKQHCVLVAQSGALAKAIATNEVPQKNTFLKELLENE